MGTSHHLDELIGVIDQMRMHELQDALAAALTAVKDTPAAEAVIVAVENVLRCDVCGQPGPSVMCSATTARETLTEPAEGCDRCAHDGETECGYHNGAEASMAAELRAEMLKELAS